VIGLALAGAAAAASGGSTLVRNLRDHNLGPNDGRIVCWEVGDSTAAGGTTALGRHMAWPPFMVGREACDVIVSCPRPGEDSGQFLTDRADAVLAGRFAEDVLGTCSHGAFLKGSGRCACRTDAECQKRRGGRCVGGVCVASDVGRDACTSVHACARQRACIAPPDKIDLLFGYNDVVVARNPIAAGEAQAQDPECALGMALGAKTTQPPMWCPRIEPGADPRSAYACPTTFCSRDEDGSYAGPCLGVRDGPAGEPVLCRISFGVTCTLDSPTCGADRDCPRGQTCIDAIGSIPWLPVGHCVCASDAQCPPGRHCVGPAGEKMCRLACDDRAACGTSGAACDADSCATPGFCDAPTLGFCQGLKACPCSAISCRTDDDCGGTKLVGRLGGVRTRFLQGTCNPATGRCAHCGLNVCPLKAAWAGGCSCTGPADCGPGGACRNGTCAAGAPARTACTGDDVCAPGQRCLSARRQLERGYLAHRLPEPLLATVVRRLSERIEALERSSGDRDGGPILVVSTPPLPGGLTTAGTTRSYAMCSGAFLNDFDYYHDAANALRAVVPPQRLVTHDGPGGFDQRRIREPLHAPDGTHFSALGAEAVAAAFARTLDRLNVCLDDATGAPQRYCRAADGTYRDVPCSGGCADGTCVRRPCNGDEAACPAPTDSCGPE
jgi:hypothetical protein